MKKIKEGSIIVLEKLDTKFSANPDVDVENGYPFGKLVNTGHYEYYQVAEIRDVCPRVIE